MPFTLNIAFTPEQLNILYATGTNVIIAKPNNGSQPNVAWQAIRPMQSNVIRWEENYGIYASTSDLRNGAVLSQFAATSMGAQIGKTYTLEPNAYISGPTNGGYPNVYALNNRFQERQYITVGLFQDANVNGMDVRGNAVSAAPVLLSSTGMMQPSPSVYIWLQSQVMGNTVVTMVTSPMTQLRFGGSVTDISVSYDSATGTFVSKSKLQAESLAQLMPAL